MTVKYIIERTTPTIYLNERGQTVQGYIVYFQLPQYGEFHEVRVPNLQTKTVSETLDKLVAEREALTSLGSTDNKK